MSTFWNLWAVILTLIFFVLMVSVVVKYWRSNHKADHDHTIGTFDGIEEKDAPPPKLLFISYAVAFLLSAGYLVLYPGLGEWEGLVDWQQSDDKLSSPSTTLDEQFAQTSETTLEGLATVPAIVSSGRILFQTHCAACHRDNGQGQKHFPNLIDQEWLYGGSDEALIHSIAKGRNGAMPGWSEIMRPDEVAKVSYYLASLNQRHTDVPEVKVELGKSLFVQYCSSCHADGTVANPEIGVPDLSDDTWLHGGSIEEIQHTINYGLNNLMPAFDNQLTENEILALGAYIRHAGEAEQQRVASLNSESVERGEYLAHAGDCVACHSAEGGEPFAGGLPFVTPFGTVYSTNITPHTTEGIGTYDFDDFRAALVDGKGKDGYLYPAMPYTSYQYLTDQDMFDLWEYMQSITAVPRRNDDNSMMFPSNIRLGLLGWNIVFMDTDPVDYQVPEELKDKVDNVEKWQQGKYWVAGLGHCSECHTPRNIAQALIPERIFQGNLIDGWNAPDITANELYIDGWDEKTLTDFLHTGHSDKGTAFAGMADVVKNSLSLMTREDIESMSYYLLNGDTNNTISSDAVQLEPKGFDEESYAAEIYTTYRQTCGACHGDDGKGRDPIAPTLLNNGIIMHSDPFNTIAVTVRGLQPTYLDKDRNFMPMASFEDVLSDQRLAELITFVRLHLGDREEPVTAEHVREVRETLEAAGYAGGLHTTPDMYDRRDNNINIR
ncbi:c-type cytochrome [Vibrio chagasii]|uniref:cytochrome c n=1 Tax=Vibrio chagasii TaxID=170679 RepID=UPI001EFC67E7|nr:cytochrome c [Vibrio chagasii]MCG9673966.1 c-type cytochrome [Vibrio chagasii]CAH6843266.1 putative diheme cytochrome c-553 [Vibrio chagasii]CAH6884018.1 putative diheme cytochrome c-553 [Vibrio chagasii]CAH6884669.1 putative diheme cytochrome c-553 [Vibrio chagasii]CAH7050160.1 putative diheme cytochrome c-553 [Vibrio chagasii]